MSVSAEVQRTLVKSPPELWAELSSSESLARHLGELGDIRITAVEPESKVEWEAEGATGVVELEQSGWGTKVTLSLTREAPQAEVEPMTEAEPGPAPDVETTAGVAVELEPEDADEPVSTVEPVTTVIEPEPAPEPLSGHEPQLGFFARLFRKRKTKLAAALEPEPVEVEVEVVAMAAPEPIYPEPPPEPAADLAAELASVEAQMSQESTELLTGVLDRLGAAHHRPFSRG
ncbi:MAG: hypothetical protein ACRDK4_08165 [Solirubrobacteraceae bacterium]